MKASVATTAGLLAQRSATCRLHPDFKLCEHRLKYNLILNYECLIISFYAHFLPNNANAQRYSFLGGEYKKLFGFLPLIGVLYFFCLFEILFGIFTLFTLANRPLFAATQGCKSAPDAV